MSNQFSILLLSILLLSACNNDDLCSDFELAESSIDVQEEYLIVDVILDDLYSHEDLIHISQLSHSTSGSLDLSDYFTNVTVEFDADKVVDYLMLNNSNHIWGDSFSMERSLINEEELNCILGVNFHDWDEYYSKFENSAGFLIIGRPILDGNRAIVAFDYFCGGTCGSGQTLILIKENGKWKVENYFPVWIS